MRRRPTVLFYSKSDGPIPERIEEWIRAKECTPVHQCDRAVVESIAFRNPPHMVIIDADHAGDDGLQLCGALKADPFTAVSPVAVLLADHTPETVAAWFAQGADEVITSLFQVDEQMSRLEGLLRRTERNVSVHPSTRLPGTNEIERAIRENIEGNNIFAVCYADLDHFKEFNDRYSYRDGDRVIFLLSRILSDVARSVCARDGFVGHIGGDDFIMVIPLDVVQEVCGQIVSIFDTLIPYQYNDQDRRAGYFFGRDRRGQLYRVPMMTLSIGIVTNQHRQFVHPARASELATEMKSYAKTLPGSVFVVDRRHDRDEVTPENGKKQ